MFKYDNNMRHDDLLIRESNARRNLHCTQANGTRLFAKNILFTNTAKYVYFCTQSNTNVVRYQKNKEDNMVFFKKCTGYIACLDKTPPFLITK